MRILICYSKPHFDPEDDKGLAFSASSIARAIYEAAQEIGQVTYIDPTEARSVRGQTFDLFVGQINQFSKIHHSIHTRYSVLFMVTTHPNNRNQILRDEAKRQNLPLTETLKVAKDTFDCADLILQIGCDWALQSLLDAGVSRSKILNIHYGVNHIPFSEQRVFAKPYKFLFLATQLGLRKGIAHVLNAFGGIEEDYRLSLVGKIASSEYEEMIRRTVERDNRIHYIGWVESNSEAYRNLLAEHHFLVFPSLEEGEAGTVLEGLSSGLVPITSGERTGIAFSPLGDFMLHGDNGPLIRRAIGMPLEELQVISRQARHYVDMMHNWSAFRSRLKSLFELILAGRSHEITRPKVSIVLSVFNKEDDIVRLLDRLIQTTKSYGNLDLHILFDGCIDRSKARAVKYLEKCKIDVKYYDTPNLFETRTNNIGLRAADGKYCVLLQDDNYLYEDHWLEQYIYFMETNPQVGALGGLAGVNYYPTHVNFEGVGTTSYQNRERSRRVDAQFEPLLRNKVIEVDAVMRGPIMLRKKLLDEHGYLDEGSFAPFYQDDMDLCFRLRKAGYSIFYYPIDVINESSTVMRYDKNRAAWWQAIVDEHLQTFYSRWQPEENKSHYLVISKPRFNNLYKPLSATQTPSVRLKIARLCKSVRTTKLYRILRQMLGIFDDSYCEALANRLWKRRILWTQAQLALLRPGKLVLDVGSGSGIYRQNLGHCGYIAMDYASTPDMAYGEMDIVGDATMSIPVANDSIDVVLCTEVLEHVSDPVSVLREIGRVLKPNGKAIITVPLGSGLHQMPYHFFGGFTPVFLDRFLSQEGMRINLIEANGGLFGHLAEMIGARGYPRIDSRFGTPLQRMAIPFIRFLFRNVPVVIYSMLDDYRKVEDFTVGYHVIAEKIPGAKNPNRNVKT